MKNLKEYVGQKIRESDPGTNLMIINGAVNIGLVFLTGLISQSRNNLADKKLFIEQNKITPTDNEVCTDNYFDTGCYRRIETELCDGQNTLLNFKDDVCEDIGYWIYNPTFAESLNE